MTTPSKNAMFIDGHSNHSESNLIIQQQKHKYAIALVSYKALMYHREMGFRTGMCCCECPGRLVWQDMKDLGSLLYRVSLRLKSSSPATIQHKREVYYW
jgi:hypothetical protein